jgi:hypothetical protein
VRGYRPYTIRAHLLRHLVQLVRIQVPILVECHDGGRMTEQTLHRLD